MGNKTYDLDICCPHCGRRITLNCYNDSLAQKLYKCKQCHCDTPIGKWLVCGQRVAESEELVKTRLTISSSISIPDNVGGKTEVRDRSKNTSEKEPENVIGKTTMRKPELEETSTEQIKGTNSCATHFSIIEDPTFFKHPATLIDLTTNKRYKLGHDYYTNRIPQTEGEYIVGRKDPAVKADVPICTKDQYMSRHHVRIIVLECEGHYIHLLRNERAVNETFLGERELDKGCEWKLQKNQILQLADTKLKIVDE